MRVKAYNNRTSGFVPGPNQTATAIADARAFLQRASGSFCDDCVRRAIGRTRAHLNERSFAAIAVECGFTRRFGVCTRCEREIMLSVKTVGRLACLVPVNPVFIRQPIEKRLQCALQRCLVDSTHASIILMKAISTRHVSAGIQRPTARYFPLTLRLHSTREPLWNMPPGVRRTRWKALCTPGSPSL